MRSTTDFDTGVQHEVRKHPIRGAIWGFFLGLSVAIYLVLFAIIAFGDWVPFGVCIAAGIVFGVVWASVAPAKQPKTPPPARSVASDTSTTSASTAPVSESLPETASSSAAAGSATPAFDATLPDDTPPGGQLQQVLDELGADPPAPTNDDLPPPPPAPTN